MTSAVFGPPSHNREIALNCFDLDDAADTHPSVGERTTHSTMKTAIRMPRRAAAVLLRKRNRSCDVARRKCFCAVLALIYLLAPDLAPPAVLQSLTTPADRPSADSLRASEPFSGADSVKRANSADQPKASAMIDAWPRFLNARMDGKAVVGDSQSFQNRSWDRPPEFEWSLDLGDGYGLGAIADDAYYHFDAVGGNERLRKIDLQSGKRLWNKTAPLVYRDMYGYEPGPRCCPTIFEGIVYTYGPAGRLAAHQVSDGTVLWQRDVNQQFGVVQNFFGVGSSPLVVGDQLLVMVGGSPEEDQSIAPGRLDRVSPNGSLLVSFDRRTGDVRWQCGDDLASYSSPRLTNIDGQEVVLVFARDRLHVIDPATGKDLGSVAHRARILESVNAMVPVVQEDRVFISDCYDKGGALYEISIKEGQAIFDSVWRDPERNRRAQSLRSHLSTPILHDGFMYACSGRNAPDSDFRCVRWSDGEVMWTALSRRRSTATLLGDVLLVLKETGELHLVLATPDDFDQLAVWDLSEPVGQRPAIRYPCWSAPIVVGDRILVRGDNTLLCLRIPPAAE